MFHAGPVSRALIRQPASLPPGMQVGLVFITSSTQSTFQGKRFINTSLANNTGSTATSFFLPKAATTDEANAAVIKALSDANIVRDTTDDGEFSVYFLGGETVQVKLSTRANAVANFFDRATALPIALPDYSAFQVLKFAVLPTDGAQFATTAAAANATGPTSQGSRVPQSTQLSSIIQQMGAEFGLLLRGQHDGSSSDLQAAARRFMFKANPQLAANQQRAAVEQMFNIFKSDLEDKFLQEDNSTSPLNKNSVHKEIVKKINELSRNSLLAVPNIMLKSERACAGGAGGAGSAGASATDYGRERSRERDSENIRNYSRLGDSSSQLDHDRVRYDDYHRNRTTGTGGSRYYDSDFSQQRDTHHDNYLSRFSDPRYSDPRYSYSDSRYSDSRYGDSRSRYGDSDPHRHGGSEHCHRFHDQYRHGGNSNNGSRHYDDTRNNQHRASHYSDHDSFPPNRDDYNRFDSRHRGNQGGHDRQGPDENWDHPLVPQYDEELYEEVQAAAPLSPLPQAPLAQDDSEPVQVAPAAAAAAPAPAAAAAAAAEESEFCEYELKVYDGARDPGKCALCTGSFGQHVDDENYFTEVEETIHLYTHGRCFIRSGHCLDCASKILPNGNPHVKRCPICRKEIRQAGL